MAVLFLEGAGQSEPLVAFADAMLDRLQDLSPLLKEVAEEILQPALGRHYDASGLKERSGIMKTAVTKMGARGNILDIRPTGLTVGIDYNAEPYFKMQIEGVPAGVRRRKVRDKKTGVEKTVLQKWKGIPPHDIFYVTEAEFQAVARSLAEKLIALGGTKLPK